MFVLRGTSDIEDAMRSELDLVVAEEEGGRVARVSVAIHTACIAAATHCVGSLVPGSINISTTSWFHVSVLHWV